MVSRVYVIASPESSGNRLLAAILVRAGCIGEGATFQRYADSLPGGESPAVVIRSMPHGGAWPNLAQMRATLEARGYEVTFITIVRDMRAVINSQTQRAHVDNTDEARDNIHKAYRLIFEQCPRVVTYEGLTLDHVRTVERLLIDLALPCVTDGPLEVEGETVNVYYSDGG